MHFEADQKLSKLDYTWHAGGMAPFVVLYRVVRISCPFYDIDCIQAVPPPVNKNTLNMAGLSIYAKAPTIAIKIPPAATDKQASILLRPLNTS